MNMCNYDLDRGTISQLLKSLRYSYVSINGENNSKECFFTSDLLLMVCDYITEYVDLMHDCYSTNNTGTNYTLLLMKPELANTISPQRVKLTMRNSGYYVGRYSANHGLVP